MNEDEARVKAMVPDHAFWGSRTQWSCFKKKNCGTWSANDLALLCKIRKKLHNRRYAAVARLQRTEVKLATILETDVLKAENVELCAENRRLRHEIMTQLLVRGTSSFVGK